MVAKEKEGKDDSWFSAFKKLIHLDEEAAMLVWSKAYKGLSTNEISLHTFWGRVEGELNRKLPDSKNDIWFSGMADHPYPEMLELVKDLQRRGIVTAVLSNNIQIVGDELRRLKLFEEFSPVLLSNEVGIAKPSVEIYELMLSKLGLPGNECVFIDDRLQNLGPAQQLGMHTILAGSIAQDNVKQIMGLL